MMRDHGIVESFGDDKTHQRNQESGIRRQQGLDVGSMIVHSDLLGSIERHEEGVNNDD